MSVDGYRIRCDNCGYTIVLTGSMATPEEIQRQLVLYWHAKETPEGVEIFHSMKCMAQSGQRELRAWRARVRTACARGHLHCDCDDLPRHRDDCPIGDLVDDKEARP
jgi:hypothetical protein